jgi:hypothetical protein
LTGEIDLETRNKTEPESVISSKGVAKGVIDLCKGKDVSDVEVRCYVFEDKDRKGVEIDTR